MLKYPHISSFRNMPMLYTSTRTHASSNHLRTATRRGQKWTGPIFLLSPSLSYLKNAADCSNSSPRLSRKAPLALYSSFMPLRTPFNCRFTKVVSRSNRSMKGVTSSAMDDTTNVYLKASSSRKILEARRRACFVRSS